MFLDQIHKTRQTLQLKTPPPDLISSWDAKRFEIWESLKNNGYFNFSMLTRADNGKVYLQPYSLKTYSYPPLALSESLCQV